MFEMVWSGFGADTVDKMDSLWNFRFLTRVTCFSIFFNGCHHLWPVILSDQRWVDAAIGIMT